MPGSIENLGSIASGFAQGFLQGRQLKQQRYLQDLQQQQQHIENLSRLSDIHKNNPGMRETIDSQLEQAIHDLDASSNGQTKKPPKAGSAGSMFSQIKNFFTGGQQQGPQAAAGTSWTELMPEADKESTGAQPTPIGPKPAGDNSQTYGDLGEYFGPATQTQVPASTAAAKPVATPTLPQPPVDAEVANTYSGMQSAPVQQTASRLQLPIPSQQQSQSQAPSKGLLERGTITNLYNRPILKNPDGSVSTTRSMSFGEDGKEVLVPTVVDGKLLTDDQAIAHYRSTGEHLGKFDSPDNADAYAEWLHNDQAARMGLSGPGGPSGTPTATPNSRLQLPPPSAIRKHALQAESTPKYGYYDATKVSARANQEATESLDEALGMAEATLDHHPQIKTFEQATADPNIGPTFRKLMDYAARLEGSGLIEKGYVDQWKENRFPDVRKGYVQPKRPDQMTPDERAEAEFEKPKDQRDPNVIGGYVDRLTAKAKAGQILTPRESSYKSAYDALIQKGRTPMQAYTELARADNAPQQPKRELQTIRNPRTGNNEYAWITEGQSMPQYTGLMAPTQFNLSSLRATKPAYVDYPGPNGTTIKMQNGTTSDYSPAEVIGAVKRGDITGSAVNLIIQETQDPQAKKTLQDFMANPGKY